MPDSYPTKFKLMAIKLIHWNLWIQTNASTWASTLKAFTNPKTFTQTAKSFDTLCNAFLYRCFTIRNGRVETMHTGSYLLFQPLKWIRYSGIFLPFSSFPTTISTTWNKYWIAWIKKLERKWAFQYLGNLCTKKKIKYLQKWNIPVIFPLNIDMSRRYRFY